MLTSTQDLARQLREAGRDVHVYTDPSFSLFPGGAVIRLSDGTIIGAVGISGRTPEEDQSLANGIALPPGTPNR